MKDQDWLEQTWGEISKQIRVNKLTSKHAEIFYLWTVKRLITLKISPEQTTEGFKRNHLCKIDKMDNFQTFCYTKPVQRQKAKKIEEHALEHFDKFIPDKFIDLYALPENALNRKFGTGTSVPEVTFKPHSFNV